MALIALPILGIEAMWFCGSSAQVALREYRRDPLDCSAPPATSGRRSHSRWAASASTGERDASDSPNWHRQSGLSTI